MAQMVGGDPAGHEERCGEGQSDEDRGRHAPLAFVVAGETSLSFSGGDLFQAGLLRQRLKAAPNSSPITAAGSAPQMRVK